MWPAFVWISIKNEWNAQNQFDHARFHLLPLVIWSRVFSPSVTCATCATHSVGAKAFGPSIVVSRAAYPLVITSLFNLPLTHIKHLDQLIDKLLFGAGLIQNVTKPFFSIHHLWPGTIQHLIGQDMNSRPQHRNDSLFNVTIPSHPGLFSER